MISKLLIFFVFFIFNQSLVISNTNDTTLINNVSESISDSTFLDEFYQKIEEELKKHLPEIKKNVKKSFKNLSKNALNNEKVMETVFRKSYQFLPLPVRLIVDQDKYVKFCFQNKKLLLDILKE